MKRINPDRRFLILFFVLFVALPLQRLAKIDFDAMRAVDMLLVFASGMSLGAFLILLRVHRSEPA